MFYNPFKSKGKLSPFIKLMYLKQNSLAFVPVHADQQNNFVKCQEAYLKL